MNTSRTGWMVALALMAGAAAQAGPILNGDFETSDLSGWSTAKDPTVLLDPKVTNGTEPGGINGPSGLASDDFAVLSTEFTGNGPGVDVWVSIYQDSITLGGIEGTLEFKLLDVGDSTPPPYENNHSGALLDNIAINAGAGGDSLSFDWYALTKKDQQRNDFLQVSFNGSLLWQFDYTDSLLPTTAAGGGGGDNYGPFSYGTGWQHTDVPVPVPEPGTWLLLSCGVVPLVRRRRAA